MKTHPQLSENQESALRSLVREVVEMAQFRSSFGASIYSRPDYSNGEALPHGKIQYATRKFRRVGRSYPNGPWRDLLKEAGELYADLAQDLELTL